MHTRAIRRDLATEPAVSEAVYDDERLAAVARAMALDTAPSDSFDRLASLAAMLLQAPMAIVTLVDDKRAFWHSCVASLACTPAGERETPVQESFCQHVISTGQALVVDDTAEDPRTRGLASVLDATVGAWAGFPVHSPDGQVLGSFCVADHEPRIWTARDVEVLSTLSLAASRDIALREAVEQARLEARRSAALARTLQESLLAPVLPRVPGLELASRYRPAGTGGEVVGDFFDVFQGLDGTWHAVIGDVCGKGVEAAKMTALARYTLRASAMRGGPPSAMLSELNDALTVPSTRYGVYLTALVMTVRVADDGVEATLALAGHPPALLRREGGTVEEIGQSGSLLGFFDAVHLHDVQLRLHPGDLLLLHTDGVTDARRDGGERFGDERLRALVAATQRPNAAALANELETAVDEFADGPLDDDMALLVLRVRDAGSR